MNYDNQSQTTGKIKSFTEFNEMAQLPASLRPAVRGTSLPMGERGIHTTPYSEVKRSSPLTSVSEGEGTGVRRDMISGTSAETV